MRWAGVSFVAVGVSVWLSRLADAPEMAMYAWAIGVAAFVVFVVSPRDDVEGP